MTNHRMLPCSMRLKKYLVYVTISLHSCAGVQHLYVHVAHNNVAAKQLYIDRCGFKEEQHESEGYARALSRARRLLLHLALTV